MIDSITRFLSSKLQPKLGGLLFENSGEKQLFRNRLSQTKIWCAEKLDFSDPAGSLRSVLLRPPFKAENDWTYGLPDPASAIDELSEKRASAVWANVKLSNDLSGRLLIFWPNESLVCGTAEHTSKGYFDVWNAPPWDTWLWFGSMKNQPPALVSWVPDQFVELAEAGISVNPEQCITWLQSN